MADERWVICNKTGDFAAICQQFGVEEATARLLVNRGMQTPEQIQEFLYPTPESFVKPELLPDAEVFCRYAEEGLRLHKKFRIFGDYDVDGVCGTYLFMTGLSALGADVEYRIPDRRKDGYGISERMVQEAIADDVEVVLTVDNGISAIKQTQMAKDAGIIVLISDHHEPGEVLPAADAVCDPKRTDSAYPGEICGAVVAAKLMELLYRRLNAGSFFTKHLDVLALATVCDVMQLNGENRSIVKLGLCRMQEKKTAGLACLTEICGLDASALTAYHLGFVLGPCINAVGRLEHAKIGVELLLARSVKEAEEYARALFAYNDVRKQKTNEIVEHARNRLQKTPHPPAQVLTFYLPECDESLAGIVAGKVREACYRPIVVLTDSETPGLLKGSARSVEGFSIFHVLQQCADLLETFGGHEQAAGLSLYKEKLEAFCERLSEVGQVPKQLQQRKRRIDLLLPFSYLNRKLLLETAMLEPFGNGNAAPLYARRSCELCRISLVGRNRSFLKLYFREGTRTYEAMYFGDAEKFLEELKSIYEEEVVRGLWQRRASIFMHLLYAARLSRFRGEERVELEVKGYQLLPPCEKPSEGGNST